MANWANSRSLDVLARRAGQVTTARQFLVFVVPGNGVQSPLLRMLDAERNFDIAARFYEAPGVNELLAESAEFAMTGGLSKFHSAALFIEQCNLHEAYDGYFFLDGDLEFDATRLSHFLSFVHAAGFALAQPSVTRDSYCYWKMAYHQPGFIFRETSFVEVMAPYISRSALAKTYETFTRSISTYGLDLVWPSLIDEGAIGVVDAFQVRHRDRVDHASGGFYRYLKSIGINLDEEERLILEQYGVTPEPAHSCRGYVWKRPWPYSRQTRRMVSVPLGEPERTSEKQVMIDLAMRFARLRPGRKERPEDHLARATEAYLSGNRISCSPS